MKFAVLALIAAVAADGKTDSTSWNKCSSGGDCSPGWICCGVTKKSDGSDASSTGIKICTDLK